MDLIKPNEIPTIASRALMVGGINQNFYNFSNLKAKTRSMLMGRLHIKYDEA